MALSVLEEKNEHVFAQHSILLNLYNFDGNLITFISICNTLQYFTII